MSVPYFKYRWVALVAVLISGLGLWYVLTHFSSDRSSQTQSEDDNSAIDPLTPTQVGPLPPIAPNRFQNTALEAAYVGAAACNECHPDEHESYLRTAHSRSLGDVDLSVEPPDHRFDHPPSRRSYRVYRSGNQIHHRETVTALDGEQIELADFPQRYVVGSGEHARTYLVETDGFLVESPVTWYASRRDWALSPGYEVFNAGFARPVVFDCLFCHAGRVAPIDGNPNRVAIHAMAIDCERCHGPGSLHVKRWESESPTIAGADLTIVNPTHLTRAENEAICAQCHFHSDAEVDVRGRNINDFRPGHSLKDFRVHFALQAENKSMVVTGHGEQMHLSPCYLQSETLTCTTCHNPHGKPNPAEQVEYYRRACLACHTEEACGLAMNERRLQSPRDACVTCHMPSSTTEIRHIAATHHRIGIHDAASAVPEKRQGSLVAIDDLTHLPEIEQDRCRGVAYLNLAVRTSDRVASESYRQRAQEILERVRRQGLSEPVMEVALAKAYQSQHPDRTISLVNSALQFENVTSDVRVEALFTASNAYLRMQQVDRAVEVLEQLVQLRRRGEDWFTLGVCRYRTGDLKGALEATRQAVAIRPDLPNFHGLLAELYRRDGQSKLAQAHALRSQQFTRLRGGR